MLTLKLNSKNPSVYHLPLESPMFKMQLFAHNTSGEITSSVSYEARFSYQLFIDGDFLFKTDENKYKKYRGWFVCAADATGHLLLGQFPEPPCWDGKKRT